MIAKQYLRHHSWNSQYPSLVESIVGLTGNTLRGTPLARGDHDKHFQKTVVDLVASALDDEDILVSDRRFKAD